MVLASPVLPEAVTPVVLCACNAAIRLCRNSRIAADGSRLEVLLDESDEVALLEVPDVALALVVLSPVTPTCERASSMELIKPPPDGGGDGDSTSELTFEVLVPSVCVELVADNCASQLFMLEILPIVMSLAPRLDWKSIQHRPAGRDLL